MISPDSKRILIVDDDVELRTMLGLMLSSEGYRVSYASSGAETISLHRQDPFDLIIIELVLKEKDGFETLAELRRQSGPVKFIATAGSGWLPSENFLAMARQLGAHHTLAKPYQPEILLAAVRKVLSK